MSDEPIIKKLEYKFPDDRVRTCDFCNDSKTEYGINTPRMTDRPLCLSCAKKIVIDWFGLLCSGLDADTFSFSLSIDDKTKLTVERK